jgi:hypothetical protein
MACTRFHNDPCRVAKQVEESSNVGKYMINTPGNGLNPLYMEDPYIRLQKWGANLSPNVLEIDSELRGLNRKLTLDCKKENNYKNYEVPLDKKSYPSYGMFTEQPRAVLPAWTLRDQESNNFSYLHYNPQDYTEIPFNSYESSRLTQKDEYDRCR